MEFRQLHGDRIAYRDEGEGPVVVLLHGMGASSYTWRLVVPLLAAGHRVIAPDLLGHGESAKPRGDYSLGAFAVGLRDLLDALKIRRATIVGHSLGGGVAMQFVHQHPQYCERLVLVNSGGLGPDVGAILRVLSVPGSEFVLPLVAGRPTAAAVKWVRRLRAKRTADARGKADSDTDGIDELSPAYASLADRHARAAFLRTLRSVIDRRGQAVNGSIKLSSANDLPVLIIWGEQDRVIPVAHGHHTHATIPGSRLVVLPDLGHRTHLDAPEKVSGLIADFIAATSPWLWRAPEDDDVRC